MSGMKLKTNYFKKYFFFHCYGIEPFMFMSFSRLHYVEARQGYATMWSLLIADENGLLNSRFS
jgi:hypothetical protein